MSKKSRKIPIGATLLYAYSFRMFLKAIPAAAFLAMLFFLPSAFAATDEAQSLPVPRFVTLGADEVNLRTGPGLRYPVRLVVRKEGVPVEVIREFDVWCQVRDVDGDEGWVHKSMLSGRRAVVVRGQVQTLLKKPDPASRPVVKLEPGVIAALEGCLGEWCSLSTAGYEGWAKRSELWGVYPDEIFRE